MTEQLSTVNFSKPPSIEWRKTGDYYWCQVACFGGCTNLGPYSDTTSHDLDIEAQIESFREQAKIRINLDDAVSSTAKT